MILIRLVQTLLVGAIGLFAALVAVDNILDYGTNFAFVQHVLSMDTTFPGNALMGRAITDPEMHRIAYAVIIGFEALTGVLCLLGALLMLTGLAAPLDTFLARKSLAFAGLGIGFLLWFVGFLVIGGEWFQMWQSATWNGQEAAFRFLTSIGVVLIFLCYER
ncbi:MAG TPA: DUF2165 domain-containing protein [Kiloniellales bacterium]|nr:DUF2165 domain-containing protein [Kiloniellales bacterium]